MDEYLITREPQTPDYRIERDSEGSKLKDVALSFGTGANSLLQMAGDFYGLATGDMDNTASRQARENIENLQRQKSPELQQAEQGRRDAIDAENDELGKALTYIRLTATDPLLLSTAIGEQLPSLVGTGGVGVVAKKGAEKLLLKTAANQAAKSLAAKKAAQIGTGAAVAAGAGIGGTDVAAGLYDEAVQSLDSISDEQAMSIPEIAKIVDERDATIDEAKAAFALTLGRQAFAVAAPISVGAQMLPGGRTIERAFVGRQVAKPIGGALAGAIGEAASEAVEEGGGKIASNILARKFDPERPIARGVGEAVGQAALVGGIPGGAAGLIFARPDSTSRPVSEGETLAGMSGQPPMPAATKPSIAPQQEATLERSEDLTPEQFWATINVRQASLLGGKPDPEDVALVGEVAPLRTEADPDEVNRVLDEASVALNNWSNDNPNAPENITLIFDPEMLHNGFGVQGAFNPKDGSILINTAFVTPENVGTIVNHEWAHATLATDEGRQALADFASREIPQEELDALAARYGTQDRIAILEEWIAGNQEKAPGVVSRIVTQIREWLSGFGIVDLTDAEVADIMLRTLREQAENRIQPDTYGTMQPTEGDRFSLSTDPKRISGLMASPSVTDINYDRAKRNLTSANQARFKSQISDYAPEAELFDAVGDWADGSENSVAAVFQERKSDEYLQRLAARIGLAADQKAVLWWRTDPEGSDAIHEMVWPKSVSMDEARQAMVDVGLENRTLIQTPEGVRGFVFDQGQQNLNKIETLDEHKTKPSLKSSPAAGDFLGSWASRTEGRRAYRRVLGSTPQTETGAGELRSGEVGGIGDRGEPEGVRYSITGGAVSGRGGIPSSSGRMDVGTGSKTSSRLPSEKVRKLADEYNVRSGQDPIEHGHYVAVDESMAQRIAEAYNALPEVDRSPQTIRAYEALAKEVGDQWDFAVSNLGITFEPWTSEGQPYSNSREMVKDVRDNNHLYFFQGGDPHPFLNEIEPRTGFTTNDKLRAVHDLFGHAAEDYQFGPRGEENAWIKHSQMFSPEAQRALSSETRGQNSWVNFGDQNYENGVNKNIPAKDRPFAAQKTALLPEELTDWRAALGKSGSEKPAFDPKSPDIRYSLTSNPIGARALEDAETMTFKNWATASKYLGDLLKKEFPGGLDGQSPETLSRLADLMDRDLSLALTMPENADAIGWYNREMKTVFDILRSPELDYQLDDPVNRGVFNAILAITSNGQKVIPQFLKTAELYNGWRKTGLIPPVGKWGGERNRAIKGHVKFLNEMLRFAGPSGTVDYLTSEQTLGDHLNSLYGMVAAANGLPETATGDAKKKALKKYLKVTMPSGELVDYNTVGAAVFGPKLGGGFFANLYGKFDRLTMDRWFMRTFHRLTGRLGEQRPQMVADTLKEARDEAGDVLPEDVSDEEILQEINTTGKQAYKNYREIKKRLKDNPDDTEAESLDLMRRLYNRYVKSKSGLFDAPDNGTHRKFIREVVDRVQKLRAERGDPPIDTSDIQAILWYLEKDIWNRLRKDMSPDVVDDADAQNDADDGDTEDTAGRVSYSDGARELYRRKVKKDYVAPNEAQPATGG
jgi:hypothetical protein